MVRLKGPLHSDQASGTLAGHLTYSKNGPRKYARMRVTPTDPQTDAQILCRLRLAQLPALWRSLPDEQKATWETAAIAAAIPGYAFFTKTNMPLLTAGEEPLNTYPLETEYQMSTEVLWRYGQNNIITAPAHADYEIAPGDMVMWVSSAFLPVSAESGHGTPNATRAAVAAKFAGVALDASALGDANEIRVATAGKFTLNCYDDTFNPGNPVGVEIYGDLQTPLQNYVCKVGDTDYALALVTRRYAAPTTSVEIMLMPPMFASWPPAA